MFDKAYTLWCKEWLLLRRNAFHSFLPVVCMVLLSLIFPLTVGGEEQILQRLAGAIVWVSLLLSMIMACEGWLQEDCADGTLLQYASSGQSLWSYVLIKTLMAWLVQCISLLLMLPIIGLWYRLSPEVLWHMLLGVVVGSPVLVLLCMLGASLMLAVSRGLLLLLLLVVPMCIPVILFAVQGINDVQYGYNGWGYVLLLAGLNGLGITILPLAITACLRIVLSES